MNIFILQSNQRKRCKRCKRCKQSTKVNVVMFVKQQYLLINYRTNQQEDTTDKYGTEISFHAIQFDSISCYMFTIVIRGVRHSFYYYVNLLYKLVSQRETYFVRRFSSLFRSIFCSLTRSPVSFFWCFIYLHVSNCAIQWSISK